MRNLLFGVVITLLILMTFKYCGDQKEDKIILKEHSALIQEQLKNVGKLVVTEGHYSQVFNYNKSEALFGNLINVEKKGIIPKCCV